MGAFETCSQGPDPVRQLSCECSVFSDSRKVEQHPYQSLSVVAGVPDGTGRRARDRTGRRRRQVHGDPHSDGALIVDHRMRCGCIGAGRAALLVQYLNQDDCRLPPMCGSLHLEHSPMDHSLIKVVYMPLPLVSSSCTASIFLLLSTIRPNATSQSGCAQILLPVWNWFRDDAAAPGESALTIQLQVSNLVFYPSSWFTANPSIHPPSTCSDLLSAPPLPGPPALFGQPQPDDGLPAPATEAASLLTQPGLWVPPSSSVLLPLTS